MKNNVDGTQLYRGLPKGSRLCDAISLSGEVVWKIVDGIPCFYWPDGRFCYEANAYVVHLVMDEPLSITTNGGTVTEYASQLSGLIRYAFYSKLTILDIRDSHFKMFINGMKAEGDEVRGRNRIRTIGSRCLDFISFTAESIGLKDYVSKRGVVRGHKIDSDERKRLHSKYHGIAWYHPVFPSATPDKKRFAISDRAIKALRDSNSKRKRRLKRRGDLMLDLFEYTGGRRTEVALVQVEDIRRASRMPTLEPLLRLLTLKNSTGYRFVPVPKPIIDECMEYINSTRNAIMLKNFPSGDDHGFLFVGVYKGESLSPDTITNEIDDFRRKAGLSEPACAHMFRHRYITDRIKRLIEDFKIPGNQAMKEALNTSKVIRLKIAAWVGHSSLSSLERYIDAAFDEIHQIGEAVARVSNEVDLEAVRMKLQEIENSLEQQEITEREYYTRMKELVDHGLEVIKAYKRK